MGRLSNPPEIAETHAAQGIQPIRGTRAGAGIARNEGPENPAEGRREKKGPRSNPPQRRLSPNDIDELIAAYRAGGTIHQHAERYHVHRTTIRAHLDRHGVPRLSEQTLWDDTDLRKAAERYKSGASLADVAHSYGIGAQTVANRFRRAEVPIRPRRGRQSHDAV